MRLKAAFDKGLTGEAAIQDAGVGAYYPDRGMYGLEGSYIAPTSTGALDLIQRVAAGTPGRTYGGMRAVSPYASPTPTTPTTPTPNELAGTPNQVAAANFQSPDQSALLALIAQLMHDPSQGNQ
jgi:hypothetical protein